MHRKKLIQQMANPENSSIIKVNVKFELLNT